MEVVKSSSAEPISPAANSAAVAQVEIPTPSPLPTPNRRAKAPSTGLTAAGAVDPSAVAEAHQLLKSLEFEMARKRVHRETRSNNRVSLRALSVLMLLVMLGAAFYAVWQLQTLRDSRRLYNGAPPPAASETAGR